MHNRNAADETGKAVSRLEVRALIYESCNWQLPGELSSSSHPWGNTPIGRRRVFMAGDHRWWLETTLGGGSS